MTEQDIQLFLTQFYQTKRHTFRQLEQFVKISKKITKK